MHVNGDWDKQRNLQRQHSLCQVKYLVNTVEETFQHTHYSANETSLHSNFKSHVPQTFERTYSNFHNTHFVEWGEVKCGIGNGGGGRVFVEKVYRSSKWWEVKDWGESVSELMIEKNNYNKLNTVLSYLGLFTFCTCCILICPACIVASFKLYCV